MIRLAFLNNIGVESSKDKADGLHPDKITPPRYLLLLRRPPVRIFFIFKKGLMSELILNPPKNRRQDMKTFLRKI